MGGESYGYYARDLLFLIYMSTIFPPSTSCLEGV